ncbi:hypothetical protein CH63R_10748 [Colletotrichum higginsianum IMI 349063]|uniref:Uncharacterized protein n=1 Tax=Colletotrichum higginsianum (strain IMI 349063) TaxID=759273 RepID=A0A1B7Y3P9_COLHI|nr:uncharacterized protein CH63R_10748 [Colletotrichum higginsianum IMI 349063]OBR06628.1 hypothetical protein CH63R_10748 [Colletotrichum higginsianum IMI 349063]GJD04503.1 hypothetical protein ColKHC_13328 [Colletotrichum higginsianum]
MNSPPHLTNDISFESTTSGPNVERALLLANCPDKLVDMMQHEAFKVSDLAAAEELAKNPAPLRMFLWVSGVASVITTLEGHGAGHT